MSRFPAFVVESEQKVFRADRQTVGLDEVGYCINRRTAADSSLIPLARSGEKETILGYFLHSVALQQDYKKHRQVRATSCVCIAAGSCALLHRAHMTDVGWPHREASENLSRDNLDRGSK